MDLHGLSCFSRGLLGLLGFVLRVFSHRGNRTGVSVLGYPVVVSIRSRVVLVFIFLFITI